jgi:hypothetical protein
MADYRIYLLDADNRVSSAVEAVCANRDEAFTVARRVMGHGPAEIWQGRECIGKVAPGGE